jgi:hypothetical protein
MQNYEQAPGKFSTSRSLYYHSHSPIANQRRTYIDKKVEIQSRWLYSVHMFSLDRQPVYSLADKNRRLVYRRYEHHHVWIHCMEHQDFHKIALKFDMK